MADREDTIHIKIKLDVDEEDRQLISNVSEDLAKTDEQQGISKVTRKGTQTEAQKIQAEEKEEVEQEKTKDYIKEIKDGPLGTINDFTKEQVNNLRQIVTNPGQFLVAGLTKKLGKYGSAAAKGGLYAIIAVLVYEIVLFLIDQAMQPGRWLDRRFRRIARVETFKFYERTLQEELRHGYVEMRVSTIQGLRGGVSQVNGNLFEFSSGGTGALQSSPFLSSQVVYGHAYLSGSGVDNRGNPKKRTVSGRFN